MSWLIGKNKNFNSDVSGWNVEKCENMGKFEGDVSRWNVGNVRSMEGMFIGACKFNADLSGWNVEKCKENVNIFDGANK